VGDGYQRVIGYLPRNATTDDGLGTMISWVKLGPARCDLLQVQA